MLRAVIFLCVVLVPNFYVTNGVGYVQDSTKNAGNGFFWKQWFCDQPLLLTPFIEGGKIDKARTCARVKLMGANNIESYSGYLTVDKSLGSNIFFWFFPSKGNPHDPVLLWLQGGLRDPVMLGIFREHGPFLLTRDMKLQLRNISWIDNHSVLYMDNSLSGYSFQKRNVTYSQSVIVYELYNALCQFFKLFPELRANYFYITGQCYAAQFVTSLGYKIMISNDITETKINLKGMAIGNAVIDPLRQSNYGYFLSQLGVINGAQLDEFLSVEKSITRFIQNGNYDDANEYMIYLQELYLYVTNRKINPINYIDRKNTVALHNVFYMSYITWESTRKAIHVGNIPFSRLFHVFNNIQQPTADQEEFKIIKLLEKYRILFYTGHLDTLVSPARVSELLESMNFSNINNLKGVPRNEWYVDGQMAGYVKIAGKLTVVTVMNAGQMVPFDQPKRALNMISRFTRNQKID